MDVEHYCEQRTTSDVVNALLSALSAITDYRTLLDSAPRLLADLLNCRCVLLYLHSADTLQGTLQFTAGSFDDTPGWSASLLTVAHINPIALTSDLPEAQAWRERRVIAVPEPASTLLAAPLLQRQRAVGVLVALRGEDEEHPTAVHWQQEERALVEASAGILALLLENTRLVERNREHIHEFSLLNSISTQIHCSLYELERMRRIVLQRTREIATTDACALLEPESEPLPWLPLELQQQLFQRFTAQHSSLPVIIERPGDGNVHSTAYLQHLPLAIKTFFAVPLISGHALGKRNLTPGRGGGIHSLPREPRVLGVLVGAYHHNRKLLREELVLLHVLASQASAVLENMHLMRELVEARNEARRLLRQALADQHSKELILESTPSGLIATDQRGRMTTFNRAAEAILGYHPYEVLGQPLTMLLDVQHIPHAKEIQYTSGVQKTPRFFLPTEPQQNDVRSTILRTRDRQQRELVLDLTTLPLRNEHAQQIGMLVTFVDVTIVHRLEEEKRRLDRLASLGEMAANVAHEVRNPLASIKTSMQMLIDDLTYTDKAAHAESALVLAEAQESVAVVLHEVERLDSIVRDLLSFARPRQVHRVQCSFVEVSEHVLQLLQPQLARANVEVRRLYLPIPPLWVDIAQLEQILLNLYMNALQAMNERGTLTISCQSLSPGQAQRDAELQAQGSVQTLQTFERSTAQWVEFAIKDTGGGISPEHMERIFQPFFTTRAHGIGLGLAITRRLVEDHGGYMLVEGHSGQGAKIVVRLPLLADEQHQGERREVVEEEEVI